MKWTAGILIGSVLRAFLGYLVLPDLAILTALAGAYGGLKFTGRGRQTNRSDDGYWDDDQTSDWDDGGSDDKKGNQIWDCLNRPCQTLLH